MGTEVIAYSCYYIDTSSPLGPVTNQEHTKRT